MSDYPDLYTDGYAIATGQYGLTLTLLASQPPPEPGVNADNAIVARIRLSKELAKDLAAALTTAVQTVPVRGEQSGSAH